MNENEKLLKSAIIRNAIHAEDLETASMELVKNISRTKMDLETRINLVQIELKEAGESLMENLDDHSNFWRERLDAKHLNALKHGIKLSVELTKDSSCPKTVASLLEYQDVNLVLLPKLSFVKFCPSRTNVTSKNIGQLCMGKQGTVVEEIKLSVGEEFEDTVGEESNVNGLCEKKCDETFIHGKKIDREMAETFVIVNKSASEDNVPYHEVDYEENHVPYDTGNCNVHAQSEIQIKDVTENKSNCDFKDDHSKPEEETIVNEENFEEGTEGVAEEEVIANVVVVGCEEDDDDGTIPKIEHLEVGTEGVAEKDITSNEGDHPEQETDGLVIEQTIPNVVVVSEVVDDEKTKTDVGQHLEVGSEGVGRWGHDCIWYRVRVDFVQGEDIFVTFLDYGNTDWISVSDLVRKAGDVPEDQRGMTDVWVKATLEQTDQWTSGMQCIAKWSVDNTWYNAVVMNVLNDMNTVLFTDYGNEEHVSVGNMVRSILDIPQGEQMDQMVANLKSADALLNQVCDNQTESETLHEVSSAVQEGNDEDQEPYRDLNKVINIPGQCAVDEEIEQCNFKEEVHQVVDKFDKGTNATPSIPYVGMLGVARWSKDGVWYRARIEVIEENGHNCVSFVDYGNTDTVSIDCFKEGLDQIPYGESRDHHLNVDAEVSHDVQVTHSTEIQETGEVENKNDVIKSQAMSACQDGNNSEVIKDEVDSSPIVGDTCIALCSKESIWYNIEILHIDYETNLVDALYIDYDSIHKVRLSDVYRSISCVPATRLKAGNIDKHVADKSPVDIRIGSGVNEVNTCQLDVRSMMTEDSTDNMILSIKSVVYTIKPVTGYLSMSLLLDGTLVVVLREFGRVEMYDTKGKLIGVVLPGRPFQNLSDVTTLPDGDFVVMDLKGFQIFKSSGLFLKELQVAKIDTCIGLTVDEMGRLVTINKCLEGDEGLLTVRGETDIIYIDIKSSKIEKRMQMEDIIEDKAQSDCQFLAMYDSKLCVVDTGLDRLYILSKEDDEEQALVFGSTGPRELEFNDPTCVAVDFKGNLIIADSRNHRLQVVSSDCEYIGVVKVSSTLSRPIGVLLDQERRELIIHDYWNQEIVKYSI